MIVDTRSDNAVMRHTLGPVGLIATLALLAVSAAMNYRFGFSLGKTAADGYIYGAASVASDIVKAIAPFFAFAAWRTRAWSVLAASLIVWLATTGFAITGAFGHAALNRLDTAGQRALASESYKDLRADLKRNQDQLSWLPAHRAADAVKAEMEGLKAHLWWTQTTECTEPSGKKTREFCAGYHKLAAELANAAKADAFNAKIEAISAKLANTKGEALMSEADPQAGIIARVTTLKLDSVQLGLALLIVAVLEIGSGLGPYAAMHYWFGKRAPILTLEAQDTPPPTPAPPVDLDKLLPVDVVPPAVPALPAPDPAPPSQEPLPPPPARTMLAGAEASLKAIGFPISGDPPNPKKPRLDKFVAAEHFVIWLKAHGLHGIYDDEGIISRYREHAARHIHEETPTNRILEGLKAAKGVKKKKVRHFVDGKHVGRRVRWQISAARFPKPATPAKEVRAEVVPFLAARGHEFSPPQWLHERIKALHRMRRTRNAKQRGWRISRRAAA